MVASCKTTAQYHNQDIDQSHSDLPAVYLCFFVCVWVCLVLCNCIKCAGLYIPPEWRYRRILSSWGSPVLFFCIHTHLPPLFPPTSLQTPKPLAVDWSIPQFYNFVTLRMLHKWNSIVCYFLGLALFLFFSLSIISWKFIQYLMFINTLILFITKW